MATYTYKVLGQSNPSSAVLSALYTVPTSTSAVISSITVANRSENSTKFRVAVQPNGVSIADQHYVAYDIPIYGNSVTSLTLGITLAQNDVVSVYATSGTLSFNIFGSEVTV